LLEKMPNLRKILVHTCCAPCLSHIAQQLEKAGFQPVVYFYNPQLFSGEEYEKRLNDIQAFCKEKGLAVTAPQFAKEEFDSLVDVYKDKDSIKYISDKDRYQRRRCNICNSLVIQKTIEQARKERIKFFTTTLLCSPYKNHEEILEVSNEKALDYRMNFYYQDFRKGYWMGRNYARNHRYYAPGYCGCEESIKERRLE